MKLIDLYDMLLGKYPIEQLLKYEDELFEFIPELKRCKGFDQHNDWHIYDVYNHTLMVVNYVPDNIQLRLAALFHDIGKPLTFTLDKNNVGHFKDHYKESQKIFDEFSKKQFIDFRISSLTSKLIYYHDIDVSRLNNEEIDNLINVFDKDELEMLYSLKKADLLSQNFKYHSLIKEYDKQKEMLLFKYKKK